MLFYYHFLAIANMQRQRNVQNDANKRLKGAEIDTDETISVAVRTQSVNANHQQNRIVHYLTLNERVRHLFEIFACRHEDN